MKIGTTFRLTGGPYRDKIGTVVAEQRHENFYVVTLDDGMIVTLSRYEIERWGEPYDPYMVEK